MTVRLAKAFLTRSANDTPPGRFAPISGRGCSMKASVQKSVVRKALAHVEAEGMAVRAAWASVYAALTGGGLTRAQRRELESRAAELEAAWDRLDAEHDALRSVVEAGGWR